ncbi:MAG: hypothetical protein NUV91_04730, partial [Candidatus Omnitrophica bacterium]|nr:hypothetical protein [Candidatus Omnitrophota bacterium]
MDPSEYEEFYGRKATLELLRKRVVDLKEGYRQNVAFLSAKHTGKTSLLRKFLADLDDADVIPIYIDLENKNFGSFAQQFMGTLLYHFFKSKGLPVSHDFPFLLEKAQELLPQTVQRMRKIRKGLLDEGNQEIYRELIALPQIFSEESKKFCILLFDEFQTLEEFDVAEVFQELGKTIMTQKRCLYLLSSSLPEVAREILSEKLSLLFGNFEIIDLPLFDLKTSQAFIQSRLAPTRMKEDLIYFLIDFTGGHPLYLHLICQELKTLSQIHRQEEVFAPLFAQAIEHVLFQPWGVLSRHFDLMLNNLCSGKNGALVASLLISLSHGRRKIKNLAQEWNAKQNVVTQRLLRLVEMELVAKNSASYYLKDRLLRYWIKYIFEESGRSFDPCPVRQREQFFNELNHAIENFIVVSRKDVSTRIIELLYCFEDEAFQINGKKYKIPLFREVVFPKGRRLSESSCELIRASSEEGEWLIILK